MSKWQHFNLNLSLERGQSCREPKSGEASEECVALAVRLHQMFSLKCLRMLQKSYYINRVTQGDEFTMHKLVKAEKNDLTWGIAWAVWTSPLKIVVWFFCNNRYANLNLMELSKGPQASNLGDNLKECVLFAFNECSQRTTHI